LPEVIVLLMLRCSPSGNNANALLAFGVGYKQHNVTFRRADDHKTRLAIILTVIETFDSKRIFKNRLCQIEAYSMSLPVGLRFGIVPFKFQFL